METKEKEVEKQEVTKKQKKTGFVQKVKRKAKKLGKKKMLTYIIVGIVLVVGACIAISFATSKSGSLTTTAESSLKEVLEVSDVSTVEYAYNSIVTVKDGDKEKYHVAYKGNVKAGFDFSKISISEDKEKSQYVVKIPEIKINGCYVDESSLDFIFIKDKYNTETVFQEAYKECVNDLNKKARKNPAIKEMAESSAKSLLEAILEPLKSELPEGYEFCFVVEESK